jgi:WD40 repeat protein
LGAPAPSTKFFFLPGRVVVYRDFGAVILDSRTGKLVAQLPTLVEERDGDPIQVAGDTIVAAMNYTDAQIGVWDAKDGRLRFTFRSPHHDDGPAFQLSGNGDRLLDCGDSPRCTLWDLRAGKALFENVEAYHPSMSDDGTRIGAVTSHGVALWDGQGRPGAQIPVTGDVASLKFSPDGARVAIATQARGSLWDAARGARLADLGGVDEQLPPDVAGDADLGGEQGDGEHGDGDIEGEQSDAIIFSSDGSRLLIKGTNDRVWLWDPRAPRLVLATGGAFRTWMSPAGRRLFIQTTKGNFTLLDAIAGKTIKTIVPSRETIDEAKFFDRAGQILLATNSDAYNDPGRQILWGYDGRKIADLGLRPSIPFVAMTPDGRRIGALLADGAVGLWGGSPTLAALHGESLRTGICRAARNGEPPFTGAERDATPVATYLRGRPWNACDWRGFDDPAGWAQTIRYWAVRAGLAWDYRPKTCSARMWEFGCPARRGA